jgi:hypothetical protein
MAPSTAGSAWELVARQHGVISHGQLRALGYGAEAIRHRLREGRLHRRARGVYAVGRPDLTWHGELMVAVLACGPGALISHVTAAALWDIRPWTPGRIELTLPGERSRRIGGLRVHCRTRLQPQDAGSCRRVPVTSPARTIVDIAVALSPPQLERAVNLADSLDLIDPDALRGECKRFVGQPGVAWLRAVLDRRTFRASDSRLEQRFLGIVRKTSLPLPLPSGTSTAAGRTSSGPHSASWSRPTRCAITGPRQSSTATVCVTRPTLPPGAPRCGSPMRRSSSRPTTLPGCWNTPTGA